MINGTHHVSLSTGDMDGFIAFYNGLLGLPLLSDSWMPSGTPLFEAFARIVGHPDPKVRVAQLAAGNLRMEVFQYARPEAVASDEVWPWHVGIRHVAFDVTDIDAEYARLKAAGVTFLSEPQSLELVGLRSVYFRDPEGNILEFQEVFPGSPVDRSHVSAGLGKG